MIKRGIEEHNLWYKDGSHKNRLNKYIHTKKNTYHADLGRNKKITDSMYKPFLKSEIIESIKRATHVKG